jgi:glutamine synthetase
LREYIKQSKKNPFEGDGYSEEWEVEQKTVSNFKTTPEALKAEISKQSLDLFSELNIMNHVEVEAHDMKLN